MGISYHPVAMYGVRFKKSKELREFLVAHKHPEFEDADDMKEKMEEVFDTLTLTPLDMFNTQEAVLGYNMLLGETVEKYQALWSKDFPDCSITPEPILAVRTW